VNVGVHGALKIGDRFHGGGLCGDGREKVRGEEDEDEEG